jgi:hypothetical protein
VTTRRKADSGAEADPKPRRPRRRGSRRESAAAEDGAARASGSGLLRVTVAWGDITKAGADVLLVGHYMGVLPQSAELALDMYVSNSPAQDGLIITELTQRGVVRGDLGEVVFFPVPDQGNQVVALGGMGPIGTFGAAQARTLARSVGQVVGLLPSHRKLATVVIGSGKGNMALGEALEPFLRGLIEALMGNRRLQLEELVLVEIKEDRALDVLAQVRELSESSDLPLDVSPSLVEYSGRLLSDDYECSRLLGILAAAADDPEGQAQAYRALQLLLDEVPDEDRRERLLWRLKAEGRIDSVALRHDDPPAMAFRLREPVRAFKNANSSRVSFWRSGDDIRTGAITDSTTVTERYSPGRALLIAQGVERLKDSADPSVDPADVADAIDPPEDGAAAQAADRGFDRRAADLFRLLVHSDVRDVLTQQNLPLIIEVDRDLARVQWEALQVEELPEPLGVARPVGRQLRTVYSPRPIVRAAGTRLRALVIGDPSPGGTLPSAIAEAKAVAALLDEIGVDHDLFLGAPDDATGRGKEKGVAPADYFDIVSLLLGGTYDIVHFAGHAIFEPGAALRSGWVFKANDLPGTEPDSPVRPSRVAILGARELEGMDRPPRLVFANACSSALLAPSPDRAPAEGSTVVRVRSDAGMVAGLADEFFKQGVSDYIGTSWEIASDAASRFASEFYRALLQDEQAIGEAVRIARKALYGQRDEWGQHWAAFQHYGDPNRRLSR